jgi:MFS family permease
MLVHMVLDGWYGLGRNDIQTLPESRKAAEELLLGAQWDGAGRGMREFRDRPVRPLRHLGEPIPRDHLTTIVWFALPVLTLALFISPFAKWQYFAVLVFLPTFLAIITSIAPSAYPAEPAEMRVLNSLKGLFSLGGIAALLIAILSKMEHFWKEGDDDSPLWRGVVVVSSIFLFILVILLGNSWYHAQLYSREAV